MRPPSLAIYTFAREAAAYYVEIGSGFSTRFARRAITDARDRAKIVSIDPEPRDDIESLCDENIRMPLEAADQSVFARLSEGDVVFIDGSHRCLSNSDATVFFLEILPNLPPGVIVGIHDIYLPDDYPPEWSDRFYSEQYLLAAYLLGGHQGAEVLLPIHFCSRLRDFGALTDHLWRELATKDIDHDGSSFWLRTKF
jgi:hypothetical protein